MYSETIALSSNRKQVVYHAGQGPPLVWLHSLYGVEADAAIVEALARRFSVYAPLAPGFADLQELDNIRDIHDLALHYDDLLETLGLASPMVAGHSFGAMIGAELAAHVPYRVSRLVLASPLGLWNDAYPVADLFGIPAAQMPTLLYADSAHAPGSAAKPDVEAIVALAQGMTTVARFLWPIPDRGLWRRLHRVRSPTLVIHGAEDRFVPPAYVDDFMARLPDASGHLITGAGHMIFVEAFDASLAAMEPSLALQLQLSKVEAPA
jgi:pimeloyl-ACP methyl ester carboxylesterase